MTVKHGAFRFGWALLWLAGLLILVEIAVSVARELRSAQLGAMAAALTLLLVLAIRASFTRRR
ncbi:hypothetical protein Q9Q95_07265 [Sphingomonas sp. DG1-23]|uniref:hypothetical protein n=1 Tax=Sphingomonas sp. DG1-23 TaxID=3068316 RepID=UPI00273F9C45|nr:hypothetical protein [Sphingomonas sp. DG1-23]MDP5278719.1 hypothetical protein [Sphingomonas sp. DG1-23]